MSKRILFAYGWSRFFGLAVRKRPEVTTRIFHFVPIGLRPIRWGGIGIHIPKEQKP